MKRQESLTSSSSRRENAPEIVRVKTIGCMAGIIHIFCKARNPPRYLTLGKKQINSKNEVSSTKNSNSSVNKDIELKAGLGASRGHNRRVSCEIPRSPTLPAEIRRSNSVNSQENFRTLPALIPRLMGLEDAPAGSVPVTPESADVKRRRLLGALQKCDEDLKAIKKIIEAVRSSEKLLTPASTVSEEGGFIGDQLRSVSESSCSEFKSVQQPSPVSVLDEFTQSPNSPSSCSEHPSNERIEAQEKQKLLKKVGEEELINSYLYDKINSTERVHAKGRNAKDEEASSAWNRKAMMECVEEVFRDIAWGEKREVGRIGLALQDHICRDLVEEIVKELGCYCFYTLPFDA